MFPLLRFTDAPADGVTIAITHAGRVRVTDSGSKRVGDADTCTRYRRTDGVAGADAQSDADA